MKSGSGVLVRLVCVLLDEDRASFDGIDPLGWKVCCSGIFPRDFQLKHSLVAKECGFIVEHDDTLTGIPQCALIHLYPP